MDRIVAPNVANPLHLLDTLLLMQSPDEGLKEERTFGIYRILIPSDLGGRLTVGFDPVFLRDGDELVVRAPGRPDVKADASGRAVIDFEPGEHGKAFSCSAVVRTRSAPYVIYATFEEVGFARDSDGTPLIPWNFWYWPYSHLAAAESAWGGTLHQPLQKYERAFGVEGALQWEKQFHNDPGYNRPVWEGHCDAAAIASIVFAPPPEAGIAYRGVHFSCEELKFLATEYCARWTEIDTSKGWTIPRREDDRAREGKFHEQRPHEDPAMFGADTEMLRAFLEVLRTQLRDAGNALLSDMRDAKGLDHREVWNQAIYMYRIRYWQTSPVDLLLVEGGLTLYANNDVFSPDGSATGFPAEPVDGAPFPTGTGRTQNSRIRVRFADSGRLETDTTKNLWRNVSHSGALLHAPRWLWLVKHRKQESLWPIGDGNQRIQAKHVLQLMRRRSCFP